MPIPTQSAPGGEDSLLSPVANNPSVLAANSLGQTKRILVDAGDGGVVVHSSNNPSSNGSPVNVFSEVDAPFSTETTILTYTVPSGQTLSINTVFAWGDYDGEFLIRTDGTLRGGGRTSAAARNFNPDYTSAPIIATANQVVTVTITHYSPSTQHFRANLLGGLN